MNPPVVYQQRFTLAQIPVSVRLRPIEWCLLFQCDGQRSDVEIALALRLDTRETEGIFRHLTAMALIEEKVVPLEDYARALASQTDVAPEPVSLEEFLARRAPAPVETPGTDHGSREAEGEIQPSSFTHGHSNGNGLDPDGHLEPISSRSGTTAALAEAPRPSVRAFRPLPTPISRIMSLKSVIETILRHSEDPTAGQLAVYRVFMGIDTRLLKRSGIHTLRFQEDRLIADPELQQAIVENMRKFLRLECPTSVFVG